MFATTTTPNKAAKGTSPQSRPLQPAPPSPQSSALTALLSPKANGARHSIGSSPGGTSVEMSQSLPPHVNRSMAGRRGKLTDIPEAVDGGVLSNIPPYTLRISRLPKNKIRFDAVDCQTGYGYLAVALTDSLVEETAGVLDMLEQKAPSRSRASVDGGLNGSTTKSDRCSNGSVRKNSNESASADPIASQAASMNMWTAITDLFGGTPTEVAQCVTITPSAPTETTSMALQLNIVLPRLRHRITGDPKKFHVKLAPAEEYIVPTPQPLPRTYFASSSPPVAHPMPLQSPSTFFSTQLLSSTASQVTAGVAALKALEAEMKSRDDHHNDELTDLTESLAGVKTQLEVLKEQEAQSRKAEYEEPENDDTGIQLPLQKVMAVLNYVKQRVASHDAHHLDYVMEVMCRGTLFQPSLQDNATETELREWLAEDALRRAKASHCTNSSVTMGCIGDRGGSPPDERPAPLETRHFTVLSPQLSDGIVRQLLVPSLYDKHADKLGDILSHMDEWSFNVDDLAYVTNQGLFQVTYTLFERYQLFDTFPSLRRDKVAAYFKQLEEGYSKSNPYHSNVHASDVVCTAHYLLSQVGLMKFITHLDVLCVFIAAAVHDYGHPGNNNGFEIATKSHWATTYNDQSVLESMHVAEAFRLLRSDPDVDFLSDLTAAQQAYVRSTVVQVVLSTDMAKHFEMVGKFQAALLQRVFNTHDDLSRHLLMCLIMKCCDINNPAKPPPVTTLWGERVWEEFKQQGDKEKEHGLPVSQFCDRNGPAEEKAKCQKGFVDFIVKPLFTVLATFVKADGTNPTKMGSVGGASSPALPPLSSAFHTYEEPARGVPLLGAAAIDLIMATLDANRKALN